MGKPLSRPGCFRKSSCCLEKHGAGDGGVGGRVGGMDVGYGDGYVPQRSIYDTMCINQQIDSHHHHPGGSIRRDCEGSFSYSASGSLRAGRPSADMFDPQPRSLTPNPSFVRRLDERAIYDSLKLGGQDDGSGCHSPGHYNRSVSPSVSSFSAPGVSSSSKKHHHHHHHHHGDSTKSRDGRQSWKVLTPPKHLECLELTTAEMMDRGGGYLNPGHYPPTGGQSSSLTSPLISPFSGSPLSSGYHTPVFFSPAKPRPSQTQSLRCSPPQVIQPRHYSQTQSLRLSPPHELRRSPYRAPLVQLSAHDLEQDLRERGGGGGWGRAMSEREREWEREREREMERGWAQREWERERERGRLERERARERERRETSTFGTFGYGRQVPLRSDRDSVFLEPEQALDTTPLLLPQPSPSPSPNAAPRMGTGAVGRNRAGSKVGHDSMGGGMVPKYDNGGVGLVLMDSKPRLVSEVGSVNMTEAEMRAAEHHRAESWNKYDNGSRASNKHPSETRMGSQVKTRPGGRELEGKVQSGMEMERMASAVSRESQRGGTRAVEKNGRVMTKPEQITEAVPLAVKDSDNKTSHGDKVDMGVGLGPGMKPEVDSVKVEEKAIPQLVEIRTGGEAGGVVKVSNVFVPAPEPKVETKVETDVKTVPLSQPEAVKELVASTETRTKGEVGVVSESQNSNKKADKSQDKAMISEKTDLVPKDQADQKSLESINSESGLLEKNSRSQKSRSSKSSSRTRPGTATGLRPGVISPRLSRGLGDLESAGPPEGIESTWPRKAMVRKRTVRQGGALHNLPILPPLPSVLSALEKRRPHGHLHSRAGHFSENPLTSLINSTSMVGRCSLKEPSHQDLGLGAGLVGRASLKEQNLEHWRVCRELDEPKRSRSKEKQGEKSKEKVEREEKKGKEEVREKEREKKEERVGREKERVVVGEGLDKESKQPKIERRAEGKENIKEDIKKEKIEIKCENVEDKEIKKKSGIQDQQELEEVVTKIKREDGELEGGEGEEGGMESWDAVLEMVTTLWDDGWDKGEAGGGEGDTDSFSGSLQRWPLLRPPIGFGGSHPPSSAASELSLTEIERRARELDSDLEHLDLSQPQRDTQDVYQTLLEPQRERADMYQTHPGPQREKAVVYTGVGSRSQVSLELNTKASPATDTDRHPADWSTKSTGTTTVGSSSIKEDSSPDSNLTLESDSSGVFMSLSNQSQEEAGSDSDQPISGSDLGSSNTSLEKDGDDGGLKEWGREESSELQWCYPSLLNTSMQEDTEGVVERDEPRRKRMDQDEEKSKEETGRRVGKIGTVSIIRAPLNHAHSEVSTNFNAPQSEELPSRKKVTLMGGDFPLPLSPSKQIKQLLDPNQKPIRTSGLDCGDIDPFVQSDSFVYLAVSARPGGGEVTKVTEVPTQVTNQDIVQKHSDSMSTNLKKSNTEGEANPTHLNPHKPEEGDFLCTDSFVYLAGPACHLLGPAGSTQYSGRESDSESSGSGAAEVSVLGCGSVAGDSDWDSDLSDSDPSRSSRFSAAGNKSSGVARPKRVPNEPDWDMLGENPEPEVPSELYTDEDRNNNGTARKVSGVTTSMSTAQAIPRATRGVTTQMKQSTTIDSSSSKKVTWQFKPAQRSVCTGSRKEKDKEMTSSRFLDFDETRRPPPSSSSSSSSSPSSSSSG